MGSASFLGTDTTTRGDWATAYGGDGYVLPGIDSALPSHAAVTPSGHSSWTWSSATDDSRGLLRPNAGDRAAATWHDAGSFTVDVTLTDDRWDALLERRATEPQAALAALHDRVRRPLLTDGRLFIVAADHTARGMLGDGWSGPQVGSAAGMLGTGGFWPQAGGPDQQVIIVRPGSTAVNLY